jgi:hypothetical protein
MKGKWGSDNLQCKYRDLDIRREWNVEIQQLNGGKMVWLGTFANAVEASFAYNEVAKAMSESYTRLNLLDLIQLPLHWVFVRWKLLQRLIPQLHQTALRYLESGKQLWFPLMWGIRMEKVLYLFTMKLQEILMVLVPTSTYHIPIELPLHHTSV